jgi:hypothetical protein
MLFPMAPKHDEVVRRKASGWTLAWDANTAPPATRRAFDKVIADNTDALRAIVHDTARPATQSPERGIAAAHRARAAN